MYKTTVTALFLVLVAIPAFAAAPAFENIDTDQDKSISQSEASKAGISEELFAQLDRDKDSKLSVEEYQVLVEQHG